MIEKEKIKRMATLQKELDGIPQIHLPRRKKLKKYNEGYYTHNINSDSLHQESEYQDITDDENYQKNKKKKPNKKEDWCDKALEDFLETIRGHDRCNKWIMFSKRRKKATKNRNDECKEQVFTINSCKDVKGVWAMHTGGNPESATAIIHKITLFKLKIVIILKYCY